MDGQRVKLHLIKNQKNNNKENMITKIVEKEEVIEEVIEEIEVEIEEVIEEETDNKETINNKVLQLDQNTTNLNPIYQNYKEKIQD